MNHMSLTATSPFMTMGTSDYHPYPMHTAQDSAPIQRRHGSMSISFQTAPEYTTNTSLKRFRPTKLVSIRAAPRPKPVQRIDSGFDDASETSSITLTEEVERVSAAQVYLHQYRDFEAADTDEEEDFADEGNLGLMHRDSICIIAEVARTWEDKAVRAKRNRKSKLKMAKKWLKRKLVPGSDGSSWYLTL
jgi:hypothetical protein